jgi:glucan phosphoethanolaminetransferase (alkaline phosphatase superfamily)
MPQPPGLESGIHVFFALLSALSAAVLLGILYRGAGNGRAARMLSIAVALFVWLSWFTVAPVYVNEYGVDKAMIKAYPETRTAHAFGMETKEHIFYTGLLLATLIPIAAYTVDLKEAPGRRLVLWMLVTLLIGFIVMESLGAWIGLAAKHAWSIKAGA